MTPTNPADIRASTNTPWPDTVLYAYSFNEEEYHGSFATREEALAEALAECEDENVIVWIGEQSNAYDSITPKHIGERIVGELNEWNFDEIPSDDDVIVATPEQAVELGNLVLAWFRANVEPRRYGIKHRSVTEHNIAADGKDA